MGWINSNRNNQPVVGFCWSIRADLPKTIALIIKRVKYNNTAIKEISQLPCNPITTVAITDAWKGRNKWIRDDRMSRCFLCNTVEWQHGKPSSLSRFQNVRFDPFPLGCPGYKLLSYSPWSRLRWWISHRLPHASSRIGSNLYAWRITLSDKINFVRFRYMGDGRGRKIDNVNPSISYHRRSTYERIPL